MQPADMKGRSCRELPLYQWGPDRRRLAPEGRILTLIKPHYEVEGAEKSWLDRGFLPQEKAPLVLERVLAAMPTYGVHVLGSIQSPLVGGKSSRKQGVPGNVEYVALVCRA
jgi:predicted rRNA methylase YqxC with S4 and FtsJ domains